MSHEADVDFSVGLALLEEAPDILDDTLGEAGDGHAVLTHEGIGDHVLVEELELELSGVGIGDDELEDLIPLGAKGGVGGGGLVLRVLQLDLDVGIGLADHFGVGKVTSFNDTNVKAAHDVCGVWFLCLFDFDRKIEQKKGKEEW